MKKLSLLEFEILFKKLYTDEHFISLIPKAYNDYIDAINNGNTSDMAFNYVTQLDALKELL